MVFKMLNLIELKPGLLKLSRQGDNYLVEMWNPQNNLRCTTDCREWAYTLFDSLRPRQLDKDIPKRVRVKEFE